MKKIIILAAGAIVVGICISAEAYTGYSDGSYSYSSGSYTGYSDGSYSYSSGGYTGYSDGRSSYSN